MTIAILTEGLIGGTAVDTTAPVIASVTPTPNTAPGAAGGMSATYSIAAATPIVVNVTDASGSGAIAYIQVTALFLDGSAEAAYRLGAFVGKYIAGSSQAAITNGIQLKLGRAGGWPGASAGGNLAVGIQVDAIGTDGVIASATFYYQMPPTVASAAGPVALESPAALAVDLTAEALALLVWQFRSA